MSISAALNNAVSGLNAESSSLSTVANNLANSSTVGYKANSTRFADLVTSSSSGTTGSGVTAATRQNVTLQGTISSSDSSTDLAISGYGYFCLVKNADGTGTVSSSEYFYSRDGEFSLDDSGYLTLGGDYYLEGYAATYDPTTGTSTLSSTLSALQVDTTGYAWQTTSSVTLDANLPESLSEEAVSSGSTSSVSTTVTIYDAAGASESVTLTFTPDSVMSDEWTVALTSSDSSVTFSPSSYTVTFDSSGSISAIDGVSGSSLSASISNSSGSQTVAFDFADLTQYDSGSDIDVSSTDQNGYIKSQYSSMSIASDGTVSATYGSGLSVTVGQIALANFANSNGLTVLSDNVYQSSSTSGSAMIGVAGENGTGTLESEALEASTTDTGTEFSKMIVSQQAYSAAAQVVSTVNEMYGTLADIKS
ncbi:MAG: hypothetical protein RLZZ501_2671 [Pseudomonadota bacterium]|jgi:flagellar hook protein FlgE